MQYHRQNPFHSRIVERYPLCKEGSKKNTQHIVLDLGGSGIEYEVGDSVGILPLNGDDLVNRTLEAVLGSGEDFIIDKRTGDLIPFRQFLKEKANLCDLSPKFVKALAEKQTDAEKKEMLQSIISNRETLKRFQLEHEVWDALQTFLGEPFSPQELCDLLMPLVPRLYSIASSRRVVGEEIHLTITVVKYDSNGKERKGVCTHYLCEVAEVGSCPIPIYIQPHKGFTVPKNDDASMIMVGPGTGVAPFRGFMQERHARRAKDNWLFFGEWNRDYDFFYEDYWRELEGEGLLRLNAAFSRDQEEKRYVQHEMMDAGSELFDWLERGGFFYVCGDAKQMAKDVDRILHEIVEKYGKMDENEAKEYVKRLRQEKRYLRDVY